MVTIEGTRPDLDHERRGSPQTTKLALLLTALSLPACSSYRNFNVQHEVPIERLAGPFPTFSAIEEKPDIINLGRERVEEIALVGNPAVGGITYYGQLHLSSDLKQRGLENELFDINAIRRCGLYQREILIDLLRTMPDTVFIENSDTEQDLFTLSDEVYDKITEAFPDVLIPDVPTDRQLKVLAMHGAAAVYIALNSVATLAPTITAEDETQIQAQVAKLFGKFDDGYTVNQWNHITHYRERAAATHILNHLVDNPGEVVALIYGGGHHFGMEDFVNESGSSVPLIKTVTWPGLYAGSVIHSTERTTKSIVEQGSVPGLQEQNLSKVDSFHLSGFSGLVSEQAQILALGKLAFNPAYWEKPVTINESSYDSVKGYLRAHARSDRVKDEIEMTLEPSVKVTALSRKPDEQLTAITTSLRLYPSCFRFITSEENQLAALPRLALSGGKSTEQALRQILSFAKTPAVSEAIRQLLRPQKKESDTEN